MKWTVNEIRAITAQQAFTFDQIIDVPEVKQRHHEVRDIKPVRVKGNCVIDGDQFIFSLNISGEMVLPCARTLVDVTYPFNINQVEVFSQTPYDKEEDIHFIEGEVIDLTPCIIENVLLSVPFRVFSDDPEVLENAILKGEGWELTIEGEEKEVKEKPIDPRLMKLKLLLDEKENN